MAGVLKLLGDVTEMVFPQRATVTGIEYIAPNFKRVSFNSDTVRKRSFQPGQWVQFRVGDEDFRHYTPSVHNAKTGHMEILFYLHDKGPGSKWVDNLKAGDEMMMMGPAGKFVISRMAPHHLFIGDETSIGGCKVMQDALQGRDHFTCLIQCASEHADWPKLAGLKATTAHSQNELLDLVKATIVPANTLVYLSGHAGTIQLIRKELMASKGIPSRQILSKAYWADNKKGL